MDPSVDRFAKLSDAEVDELERRGKAKTKNTENLIQTWTNTFKKWAECRDLSPDLLTYRKTP